LFTIRDPMRGKSFLSNQARIEREVYEKEHRPQLSDAAIVRRDTMDVMQSDILLVYLNDAATISIGTVCELYLGGFLNKLVVLVMKPENIHDHPFVRQNSVIFHELRDAIDYIISCHPGEENV
jgi:hypothetical protein